MTKLKPVGIYREMYRTPRTELPSLEESYTRRVIGDRSSVVEYMRAGTPVFDVMEDVVDLVGRREWIRSGPSLLSDGVWVWRVDSAYYLQNYSLDMPDEFLEHVRQRNYRPDNDIDLSDPSWRVLFREAITAYF